jgi:O-antigen/teichoic acid export membrane protein
MLGTLTAPFDNILIGHLLGPATVAPYAVAQKLTGLAFMIPTVILTPLWPAYSEALSRGDVEWVRWTFRKAIVFSALTSGGIAAALILFGRQLVLLWVGRAIAVPLPVMVPLAILMVVNTIGDAGGSLLYSANGAKYVLRSAAAWSILGIVMKLWATSRYGVVGLAWAAALACLIFFAVPNVLFARRVVSRMCRRVACTTPVPELA